MHACALMIDTAASASLPLGLIVGIAVGGTILISVVLCIIIVLVCVMCRTGIHDKSIKPQSGQLI